MNSSKTSRQIKAMHIFHLEQKNNQIHQFTIPILKEPISAILKPYKLSPNKQQSFPTTSRSIQQNTYRKLSLEKKLVQLRKNIYNAKQQKPKTLILNNQQEKQQNQYSQLDLRKIIRSVKTQKQNEQRNKQCDIPFQLQDKIIQQQQNNNQAIKIIYIPKLKFKDKPSLQIDDLYNNEIPFCQPSTKQPSEPNSPFFIKKLEQNQYTQRSVSQGNFEKPNKPSNWVPWPQHLEGWNIQNHQPYEDILLN